jgi:hypothetical protein
VSEHHGFLAYLNLVITGAELYQPHRRRCRSRKLLFGFLANIGTVFQIGFFLSKLHGKGQARRHTALLAIGFGKEFEDF